MSLSTRSTSLTRIFWLLNVGLASVLFLPQLLNEGMFFDGLSYSTLAQNIANDQGNIWATQLSKAMWNPFYGHPPLVLYIESFFFRVFGDGWFSERWFCIFIFAFSIYLIHRIWLESFPEQKSLSWMPVFLWIITPGIYTFYARNLLEPTMGVFTMLSILFFLKGTKRESVTKFGWFALASAMIICSFLSKGFPGLFPLALPVLYGITTRKWSIAKSIGINVVYGLMFVLLAVLLMLFESPRMAMEGYLNTQVISSVQGAKDVHPDGHLHIIWVFFEDISYMSLITAVIVMSALRVNKGGSQNSISRLGLFFILIAISASWPVALSPKQRSFYILACFAPMAIGIVGLYAQDIWMFFRNLSENRRVVKSLGLLASGIFVVGVLLSFSQFKKPRKKDVNLLHDVKAIHNYVGDYAEIGTNESSFKQVSSIHAYLQRYGKISLDTLEDDAPYVLRQYDTSHTSDYKMVDIELRSYTLYQKVD